MDLQCENCGEVVQTPKPDEALSRLLRDATDGEPKSFLITAQHASGWRLLHRCLVTGNR